MATLFSNGDQGYACYNIPSLVATENKVFAFAEARRYSCDDTGDVDIASRFSNDEGMTWSPITIVSLPWRSEIGNSTIGDACPVVLNSSAIMMVYATNNTYLSYTLLNIPSNTWSTPTLVPPSLKPTPPGQFIGTGHAGGTILANGNTLFPVYTGGKSYSLLYNNDGQNWTISEGVIGGEAQVVILPNNSLYSNARNNERSLDLNKRYGSVSSDNGLTWSVPVHNGLIEPIGGCEGSTIRIGRRLFYTGPANPTIRTSIVLWHSITGFAWHTNTEVISGPAGYSALATTKDEKLHILAAVGENYDIIFKPTSVIFKTIIFKSA